jgi:Na+/proline symporter
MKHIGDGGSVAMIFWVPITIGFALFLFIGLGKVVDLLTQFQNHFQAANPSLPVSAARIQTTGWMITGFQALLVIGILLPVIYYAIITSKKRTNNNI